MHSSDVVGTHQLKVSAGDEAFYIANIALRSGTYSWPIESRYGLYSYGLYRYGLFFNHGLCSYGLYSPGPIGMVYIVMG